MKQCKYIRYRQACSLTLFNSIFLCCAFFLNSNWSFKHTDVSYGSTQRLLITTFFTFFLDISQRTHIMSQRVQALKFFSSIVKYLSNLMVHTIVYRTYTHRRHDVLWMVQPIRCYLLQVTFLWLTGIPLVCFSRRFSFSCCSLFTCHLLVFPLDLHTCIASINKI